MHVLMYYYVFNRNTLGKILGMNFVCTVFEQGDEILTLLSMEKQW